MAEIVADYAIGQNGSLMFDALLIEAEAASPSAFALALSSKSCLELMAGQRR